MSSASSPSSTPPPTDPTAKEAWLSSERSASPEAPPEESPDAQAAGPAPAASTPATADRDAGTRDSARRHDREIIALALPAFGALVAEPLFVMTDSAIIGHLGTPQLAGLGVAAALLTTAVNVFVFLAYATTAAVARRIGAGDQRAALQQGIDGIWLAVLLGGLAAAFLLLFAPALVSSFGTSETAAPHAVTYLRISALGVPAMLVVLAATGVLRGLQDTRTPLYVAIGGFSSNAVLSFALVHGAGFGIAGSAWGTFLAQWGMAAAYLWVVVRGARRELSSGSDRWWVVLRPDPAGIRACAQAGVPLLVRTLSLRAVLLIVTGVAARLGDADVAAHQVALTLWSLLSFGLDAIAIAGQAIIGRYLGAEDERGARAACRRMVLWGVASGAVMGALVVLARPLFLPLFTTDSSVQDRLLPVLLVVAVTQPIAGVVYVLDGVLMGAGDGTYLAVAMLLVLAIFSPVALLVPTAGGGLTALWWTFGGLMMGARLVTLWLRTRSGRWIVTGAVRG